MHLILTGATGLVGSAVLQVMLTHPAITTISVLSRRPVPQTEGHPKAKVIIHKDFLNYPPDLLEQLRGAEGCVWALGISQQLEPDVEKYTQITKDYPLAGAKAFSSLSSGLTPFKFIYVSGEGATTTPGRFSALFARVKGEAENDLLTLSKSHPNLQIYNVRPGGVDATHHPEIHPFIPVPPNWAARLLYPALMPVLRVGYPSMVSPTRQLGEVLVKLAMGDGEAVEGKGVSGEGRTLNNQALRRLAGL